MIHDRIYDPSACSKRALCMSNCRGRDLYIHDAPCMLPMLLQLLLDDEAHCSAGQLMLFADLFQVAFHIVGQPFSEQRHPNEPAEDPNKHQANEEEQHAHTLMELSVLSQQRPKGWMPKECNRKENEGRVD